MTRSLFRLVAAFLVAVVAAPLASAAPEKPEIKLAVGGRATLYYLPLALAERLGYFRDEGLEVEVNDFPGGAKALQALIGGSADVVSGGYEHTIQMQAKGQKLQAFVLQGHAALALGLVKGKFATYAGPRDLKGRKIGVTAGEIERIKHGSSATGWDEADRAILRAAEELHADAMISDATWAALAEQLSPSELIELMMIAGHYHTTAFIQNSLRFRLNDYNRGLESV